MTMAWQKSKGQRMRTMTCQGCSFRGKGFCCVTAFKLYPLQFLLFPCQSMYYKLYNWSPGVLVPSTNIHIFWKDCIPSIPSIIQECGAIKTDLILIIFIFLDVAYRYRYTVKYMFRHMIRGQRIGLLWATIIIVCAMLYLLGKPFGLQTYPWKFCWSFFWDTKHMVKFNAFECFGSFRFTMQQCELDIDNFLSGGSNFPHKKSFIKLPLAAQQHLEGNGKMLKWTEGGDISCSLHGH